MYRELGLDSQRHRFIQQAIDKEVSIRLAWQVQHSHEKNDKNKPSSPSSRPKGGKQSKAREPAKEKSQSYYDRFRGQLYGSTHPVNLEKINGRIPRHIKSKIQAEYHKVGLQTGGVEGGGPTVSSFCTPPPPGATHIKHCPNRDIIAQANRDVPASTWGGKSEEEEQLMHTVTNFKKNPMALYLKASPYATPPSYNPDDNAHLETSPGNVKVGSTSARGASAASASSAQVYEQQQKDRKLLEEYQHQRALLADLVKRDMPSKSSTVVTKSTANAQQRKPASRSKSARQGTGADEGCSSPGKSGAWAGDIRSKSCASVCSYYSDISGVSSNTGHLLANQQKEATKAVLVKDSNMFYDLQTGHRHGANKATKVILGLKQKHKSRLMEKRDIIKTTIAWESNGEDGFGAIKKKAGGAETGQAEGVADTEEYVIARRAAEEQTPVDDLITSYVIKYQEGARMKKPSPSERKLLYRGLSKEGEGRQQYLKNRYNKDPREKFEYPVTGSQQYGWYQDKIFPDHPKQNLIQNSFYRRNLGYEDHSKGANLKLSSI
eukprot:Nk52_evm7s314 gene=Nk52_evmTU7s314